MLWPVDRGWCYRQVAESSQRLCMSGVNFEHQFWQVYKFSYFVIYLPKVIKLMESGRSSNRINLSQSFLKCCKFITLVVNKVERWDEWGEAAWRGWRTAVLPTTIADKGRCRRGVSHGGKMTHVRLGWQGTRSSQWRKGIRRYRFNSDHLRIHLSDILGENQNIGRKGGNSWWRHRRFSIIGGTRPGCFPNFPNANDHGWRLWKDWETVPPKFEVGTAMNPFPQYLEK